MVTQTVRRIGPGDVAAFAAIYGIWGSTYLAVKLAIDSIPPFTMTAIRCLVAGAILYGWGRWRGGAAPTARQWGWGVVVGAVLILAPFGGVAWAEQRVPSGVTALIIGTVPLWMTVLDGMADAAAITLRTVVGVAFGLLGILLLVGPNRVLAGEPVDLLGAGVLVLVALSWSVGSALSKSLPRAASLSVANGTYLLTGAVMLGVVGVVGGEPHGLDWRSVTGQSLAALGYLVVFGSIMAFGAYTWLLRRQPLATVSTYAFVNPIVAVVVGWAFGGEALNSRVLAAATLVVGAVVMILSAGSRRSELPVRAAGTPRGEANVLRTCGAGRARPVCSHG